MFLVQSFSTYKKKASSIISEHLYKIYTNVAPKTSDIKKSFTNKPLLTPINIDGIRIIYC